MIKDSVPLAEVQRALVVKLRHHGDVLLTSPVFSVLKEHAPHIEIDALVYSDTKEMLTLHPSISELHTIDRSWKRLGPFGQTIAEYKLLQTLRARRHDLIIHLTEHPRGAWLARLIGTRWAVAPAVANRSGWWNKSFTHFYSSPRFGQRHAVELNLDALRRIGLAPTAAGRRLTLVPGPEADSRVLRLLHSHGLSPGQYIHIHPSSRWSFKCWTTDRMAKLIDRLQADNWRVLITAAPNDDERTMVRQILTTCQSQPIDLSGQLSLKEMAALTAHAKLFIGVDSAPMHIAAAVGTPLVALFGPSGENDWGPWQVPAQVVTSNSHPCRPCGMDGCGNSKRSDCLEQIEVDQVLSAVRALLAANKLETPCPLDLR